MFRLFFLLFLPVTMLHAQPRYNSSKISAATLITAKQLAGHGTFYSKQISPSGGTTSAWSDFSTLRNKATLDELKELSRHPDPVVRCYAFLAVAYRDSSSILPLLLEHVTDTQKVLTRIGCFNESDEAGHLMYTLVLGSWGNYTLDEKEVARFDSVVLHHPSKTIRVRESALSRIKNQPEHYDIIRAEALTGNKKAIVALATYRNLQDTALILSLMPPKNCGKYCFAYDFFDCVRRWPAPFFLPKLKQYMHGNYWEQGSVIPFLWSALAAYRTEETVALLCEEADYFARHPSPIFTMYDMSFILDDYKDDPVVNPLLSMYVKYKDAELPLDMIHELMRRRPQLAWEATKFYLDSARRHSTVYYFHRDSCKTLLPRLLDIGLALEHDRAVAFMNRLLKDSPDLIAPALCTKAAALNDPALNEGLLVFIATHKWLYQCLDAAKILLDQKNPALDQRVVEASRKNKEILTWQAWKPRFDELFESYGVKH
ncbi:MAG: hypothetical protein FD123_697 [Bacteroidetes bacterium]|nr:MAG: hypothetical protein FD123_697 [Bacteroidota bacterium]